MKDYAERDIVQYESQTQNVRVRKAHMMTHTAPVVSKAGPALKLGSY